MRVSDFYDTFKDKRENIGTENFVIKMIQSQWCYVIKIRKCAHNWKTYRSGGKEIGRIVIPQRRILEIYDKFLLK